MKFNQLNVKAYGHFTDFQLDFKHDQSMYFIFGPNEAGKSTMLRAFRSFLFGIDHITKDSFKHQNANLRIEGSITAHDGMEYSFARKKGRTNTIIPLDDQKMTDEKLQSILHINEEFFKNLFGLDYQGLRNGGESILNSGGNVGASIFAASSGMNHIRGVLQEIKSEEEKLFKGGRAKREIDHLVEEYRKLKKVVNDNSLSSTEWNQLQSRTESLKEKITTLENEKRDLSANLMKLERIKRNFPLLAKRENCLNELERHGDVKIISDEMINERIMLETDMMKTKTILQTAMLKVQTLIDEISKINVPDYVLAKEGEIDQLNRNLEMYRKFTEQLPSLLSEHTHNQIETKRILAEISPNMSLETAEQQYKFTMQEKETIRHLAKKYDVILNELQTIKRELQRLMSINQLKTEELAGFGNMALPSKFRELIEMIKAEGKIELINHDLLVKIEELLNQIRLELDLLQMDKLSIDAFLNIPMPPHESIIHSFIEKFKISDKQLADIQKEIELKQEDLNKAEEQLRKIVDRDFLTKNDLEMARNERNNKWTIVRKVLTDGHVDEEKQKQVFLDDTIHDGFEKSLRKTDRLSDQLIEEASIIGENKKLLTDKEDAIYQLKQLELRKDDLLNQKHKLDQEWQELWKDISLKQVMSPLEMIEWRKNFIGLRQKVNQLDSLKKQSEWTIEKIKLYRAQLFKEMNSEESSSHDTLESLLKRADTYCIELENQYRKTVQLKEIIKENEQHIKIELQRQLETDEQLKDWSEKWKKSISKLEVDNDTIPEIVVNILNNLDKFFSNLEIAKKENTRIIEMNKFLAEMEQKSKQLAESMKFDYHGKDVETIIQSLYKTIINAKEEATILSEKNRQLDSEKEILQDAKNQSLVLSNQLNELFERTDCSSIEELIELENRSKQMISLKEQLLELQNQLLDNGSGLQIEQLIDETNGVESADIIVGECESIIQKIELIENEIKGYYQDYGVIKKEYDEIIEGSSLEALESAETKERLLEEIRKKSEEFILLRLSSVVLSKGIERFREQNQGPIVKRASEIFAKITLGSFTDLIVDFDDKDSLVFKGIRPNGEYVQVDGMSDGTQDQLYLSLRIASIEHFITLNEPVPFIVDDILVHFDDERSKETLKILSELAKHTQVIFFTHHKKIIDLAKEVLPQSNHDIIEIERGELIK